MFQDSLHRAAKMGYTLLEHHGYYELHRHGQTAFVDRSLDEIDKWLAAHGDTFWERLRKKLF